MPHVSLNGVQLYYETAGTGTPVVLIHSWGTSLRVWDGVIADLSADHQVVAYDWRGCGRSERTSTGNTIGQNAADLLALIDHLSLDRPVLVGSSVGGLFACEAARRAGQRIGGVVVVDGPGHWGTVMADVLRARRQVLAADRAAALTASANAMYGEQASQALRDWTARQTLDASPHIDVIFEEQASYDPRPWLPEVAAPIRYLHGSLDQAVPVRVAEELASLSKGAVVVTIEGAGHMAHQERPAEVAAAIRTFSNGGL